jgi:methanogenic corrinoid protein MtbC1
LSLYKLDIISHEIDKAKSLLSSKEFCLDLLVPLFQSIDKRVTTHEITLAQKQTLQSVVSFHIGQMIVQHYQKSPLKEELILISTADEENFESGILESTLLFLHYGVKFIYLGANLPIVALAEAVNSLRPKMVLLGVSSDEHVESFLSEFTSLLTVNVEISLSGKINSELRSDLEKRRINYFPSFVSLDQYLNKLLH